MKWQQNVWVVVPAEGLEQLQDHRGQFVQTGQSFLWKCQASLQRNNLHGARVKAQCFEHLQAEMWQKKMILGVSGMEKKKSVVFMSCQELFLWKHLLCS